MASTVVAVNSTSTQQEWKRRHMTGDISDDAGPANETAAGDVPQSVAPEPSGGSVPVVEIDRLVKHFRRGDGTIVRAIDDISLEVHAGEFVVLLGPSGCGKTTLLRAIAGLETPDSGTIMVHGDCHFSAERRVNLPPQKRLLGMIFQSYALWPHMTALKNVAYPLQSGPNRLRKSEIVERCRNILELVGIPELEGQYPNQMSGGQQQRVALARALVAGNDLVLFDEPLSNVDAKVREQLRFELASMQREIGFAAIYVTHDQTEAMELADRIAVLETGRVAQEDTPREIYERPTSRYVANFIGTTNELTGTVVAVKHDQIQIATDLGDAFGVAGAHDLAAGEEVVGVWRPERGRLVDHAEGLHNCWPGIVSTSMFVGSHTEHAVQLSDRTVRLWNSGADLIDEGSSVNLHVPPNCLRLLRASAAADPDLDGTETKRDTNSMEVGL